MESKRGCWEQEFGTSEGRKAIDMEMEKQIFGKQILLGPEETTEHRVDPDV